MTKIRNIPWPRVLGESVIIVASILLAFWLQSWWDARQLRADENQLLKSLLIEIESFEDTQIRFDSIRTALLSSAEKLLEISLETDNDTSQSDTDSLISDLTWYMDPTQIPTPELDSVVTGGNVSQISNVELRQKIINLQSALVTYRTLIQADKDFYFNRLLEFFGEEVDLVQINNADDGEPGGTGHNQNIFSKYGWESKIDHRGIVKEPAFRNILMRRIWLLTNATGPSKLEEMIDDISTLIEQQTRE